MLVADRLKLVQSTNQQMVDYRKLEIDYFVSIYKNFGYQCAFIAGFVLNAITNLEVKIREDDVVPHFYKYLYCISSALAFILSTNVVLTTCFIIVYGQGLAIRGPIGSLSVAIEGMMTERHQTMNCFVGALSFFGLQIIGIFFIQMTYGMAILCSLGTLAGFTVWYFYALRIYNRFDMYERGDRTFEFRENNSNLSSGMYDENDHMRSSLAAPLVRSLNNLRERHQPDEALETKKKENAKAFFSLGLDKKERESLHVPSTERSSLRQMQLYDGNISFLFSSSAYKQLLEEHPEISSSVSPSSGGTPVWVRCYAVMNEHLIYLYKDKNAFKSGQEQLRRRPLDFEGFDIGDNNSNEYTNSNYNNNNDDDVGNNSINTSASIADKRQSSNDEVGYQIKLIPTDPEDERKPQLFRCDTFKEAEAWRAAFRGVILGSQSNSI